MSIKQIYTKSELILCLDYVCTIKAADRAGINGYEAADWVFPDDIDGYDDLENLQWVIVSIPAFDPIRNKRLVRLLCAN